MSLTMFSANRGHVSCVPYADIYCILFFSQISQDKAFDELRRILNEVECPDVTTINSPSMIARWNYLTGPTMLWVLTFKQLSVSVMLCKPVCDLYKFANYTCSLRKVAIGAKDLEFRHWIVVLFLQSPLSSNCEVSKLVQIVHNNSPYYLHMLACKSVNCVSVQLLCSAWTVAIGSCCAVCVRQYYSFQHLT